MSIRIARRSFLGTAAGGLASASLLSDRVALSDEQVGMERAAAPVADDIGPLVRLLEETPRENLLEEVGHRIRRGLSYREVLTALLLAGVRNVQPRPSVGYKFHAVLVVNSAHLASLSATQSDRWVPIFWALDYFKSSQARDVQEGDWTMAPVNDSKVPSPFEARRALVSAMENWDERAADVAVTGLARSAGANEVFEIFARYGARDFRSIGHKAIFVANSRRTLATIGWRHAEPVLRSLAYALLMHEGGNPAERDEEADLPWRRNQTLARAIRDDWLAGRPSREATTDMLSVLREGSHQEACGQVVELLERGVAPASIWDALFAGAGELTARQPGIVALHAVTTTNALHYAYRNVADDLTRRLLLLQNAAFLPMFREAMAGRGRVGDAKIDALTPLDLDSRGPEAAEEVFSEVSRDRMTAARKALTLLQEPDGAAHLTAMARRLILLKGDDAHDYKFSSAALEDCFHVSHAWRDRFLAASLFCMTGSGARDNRLIERTRAALQA